MQLLLKRFVASITTKRSSPLIQSKISSRKTTCVRFKSHFSRRVNFWCMFRFGSAFNKKPILSWSSSHIDGYCVAQRRLICKWVLQSISLFVKLLDILPNSNIHKSWINDLYVRCNVAVFLQVNRVKAQFDLLLPGCDTAAILNRLIDIRCFLFVSVPGK